MLLLEQDIIKKMQVDNQVLSKQEKEFEIRDNKEYKVKVIVDSAVYVIRFQPIYQASTT